MTVQGQRVVATTGIKCVGNRCMLHGVPYSPPYRISAIGDPAALLAAIDNDPYLTSTASRPRPHDLGRWVEPREQLRLPGTTGSTELSYAQPPRLGTTVGGNGQTAT